MRHGKRDCIKASAVDPNAPEAEGCGTQACGLALWRQWLPAVLGAPVMLTQGHGGV